MKRIFISLAILLALLAGLRIISLAQSLEWKQALREGRGYTNEGQFLREKKIILLLPYRPSLRLAEIVRRPKYQRAKN